MTGKGRGVVATCHFGALASAQASYANNLFPLAHHLSLLISVEGGGGFLGVGFR